MNHTSERLMSPPVVIVPVYQALEELRRCVASLEQTLPAGSRVLLADDASPDPAVPAFLATVQEASPLSLQVVRRERNLGFVGNVNRALQETAPHDVILFNSDAWAIPGWYEALQACAQSDTRIATITPWSNNAEICSWPRFCHAAPMPTEAEVMHIVRALKAAGTPHYPELPTGVGFCLFVRRAALEAVGDLDQATFGRGYGEENDFCLRVAGHGWRNVLCDNAYVVHRGGASFSVEGHHPGGENLARLLARYPHYNALIADFIQRDPLAALRERLTQAYTAVAGTAPTS